MKMKTSNQRGVFALAFALVLAFSVLAHGQAAIPDVALNRYEPAERGSEWFANESLDFRGDFRPAFGAIGDYGHAPYTLLNPDGTENTVVIQNAMYLHLGVAFVFVQRLRLGLHLPVAVAQDGTDKTVGSRVFRAPSRGGVGDLRIAADLRLAGEYGDPFTVALGGRLWVPTSVDSQYIGDNKVRIGPRLTFAGDIGTFVYSGGIGAVWRADDTPLNGHPNGTEATFSAAIGLRVADRKLILGPELYGSTVVSEGDAVFGAYTTPMGMVVSLHYTAGPMLLGIGAGPGLSKTIGTPVFRGLISVDYIPEIEKGPTTVVLTPADRDGDGIIDSDDACIDIPGIRSIDPRTNGCPADRDADGIIDNDDACPAVAGVKTNDPKTNGCPADRDGDGVTDGVDACPDVAGMKTEDPKTNGCPPDGDKDGVYDKDDACPTVAGVKTEDPKTNGCPPDRDKDGIIDPEDACPDAPGPKSSDPKRNGCPLVYIDKGQVRITEQIKFKTNSAEIVGSQNIIDEVAKTLKAHPEIQHLRVQGHTDNVGKAAYNKELSRKRAASVAAALVRAGIPKAFLSSEGFGLEKPIEDNSTEEGRAANRRVEFHIEEAASKK